MQTSIFDLLLQDRACPGITEECGQCPLTDESYCEKCKAQLDQLSPDEPIRRLAA